LCEPSWEHFLVDKRYVITGPNWPSDDDTMDFHPQAVAAPLFHSGATTRSKVGRPLGSKAQVVQDARALGIHHFAFVRSSLLGLDLAESFDRYLAWSESTTDLRYVQNRREALLKRIIEAGRQHDATLSSHSKITHLLDLLRSDAAPPKAVALPSLDDWVASEGMDPEGWSEAELLAEYKAAFGLDNVDAIEAASEFKDPVGERVRALNYLETVLSVIPKATDRLESWFARPVVKCLRNMGIINLGDLVRFINVYGHRWYSTIKGFGAQRAKQVVHWLILEQDHLNLLVSASVHEPKSKRELRVASLLPSVGQNLLAVHQFGAGTLVASAIQHMQATPALAGGQGDFRSHMANTLGAKNDLEAVSAWLSRYNEKPSTQRSYRKEAERFLLWCAKELKKPLSSVNSPDCQKYREFLQAVPATWMQRAPFKRTDPGWRAFRSQPSAASQKQALVILQTLFGGLVDAGYLVANPTYAVLKRFFKHASKSATQAGLDEKRFEKASTHWMRHTFVRQALVDGVPIEVASELARHASIDTTSIYSTQELARKIRAVRGMRRRVAE
jgi:hypothetical protein